MGTTDTTMPNLDSIMNERKAFDETKSGVKGLVDEGLKRIPEIFHCQPDKYEKANNTSHVIPVIDLKDTDNKDPSIHQGIVEKVKEACETLGFFQVVNHGIPLSILEDLKDGVKRFYELDTEVKKDFYTRDMQRSFIYNSNYDIYSPPALNWRDTFACYLAPPDTLKPEEIPVVCRDILLEYGKHMMNLGTLLFELLSEALGLSPNHLKDMDCAQGLFALCHYYPACPEPELTVGTAKHSDHSFLTVLLQDHIGGLQVLYKDKWIDITPVPGALIVNIGDLLQLLEKLKFLNLSHSPYLKSTPDFSKLPNLEKLIMKDCPSLSELHSSIGDLKNILLINLRDCTSLASLPREIYHLISVKTLILSGCLKIDKLEEDILQMESLTTIIAANTGVKQVPFSIVRSESIGYISLCGYEGLSCDVFPSLIWSWMSPTRNSLSRISPFVGNSLSSVSLDVQSNNTGYQSPMLTILSKLRCVLVQCLSEIQLTQELKKFVDDLYDVNFTELETTLDGAQISNLSLRSVLIGMGSSQIVMDTLGKSLSQGLATNSSYSFLPGDNYPSLLAYKCEGPSVLFQVPEDSNSCMKGITLCVVYSSTPQNLASECLTSVLIINYTKLTIQIYKRDTIMSFNDEDWKGLVSNFGVGDNVEIFVAIGHGLTVKETVVYLVYDQSNAMEIGPSNILEIGPSTDTKIEPLHEVEEQSSPNVKTEPSAEEEVQPSIDVKTEPSLVVKKEPMPKTNRKIFTRLAKRVGEYLCLNQN